MERLGNDFTLKQLKEDVEKTNNKIGRDIPNRELERSERASARKKRENIRERFPQDRKQLTLRNQAYLQKSISEAEKTLQSRVKSLITQAEQKSYSLFLKLLSSNINSQFSNSNILVNLSETMQQYENLQQNIRKLINSLHEKEQQYRFNEKNLKRLEEKRDQLQESNQKLSPVIDNLKNEHSYLKSKIKEINKKIENNTKVCTAMLLLVGLILLSIGVLLCLNTVPTDLINYTIGVGASALAALGFFACRFFSNSHQKSTKEAELSENERETRRNEEERVDNEHQIQDIEANTIPKIRSELNELPPIIQNLQKEIEQTNLIATELFKNGALNSEPFVSQGNININLPPSFFKGHNVGNDYYAPSHATSPGKGH